MTAPRILVVDDTPGNRYAVSRILRGAGMTVSEAASGIEALQLVEDVPDLVILDVNLPDMTGYEVCRHIKASGRTSMVPIMHLSASYTASADRAFGLEAGADAYLTHPLDPAVFVATARALLRASAAESKTRVAAREWQSTFDAITAPVFLVWFDGTVKRCNHAAAALLDTAPDEVTGCRWPDVLARLALPADTPLTRVTHSRVQEAEVEILGRWYSVTTSHAEHDDPAQAFVVCVMTDITARRAADREREELLQRSELARAEADAARTEAENANRAKSDFLAVMSHELRTPLNAIGGFTELIALGVRGPVTEAQLHDLDRIRRSQITLISLINDLLGFAKLESGSVQYDIQRVDAGEALRGALELMESQLRAKRLTFTADVTGDVALRADTDKLQQILLNLLSNAIKFTDDGGAITLTCVPHGDRAIVEVTDTGRGISPDKLSQIFDPFMQVDQRLVREHHGVGLGLSISRDLARGMGGELTATSRMGEGSVFTLELPLAGELPRE